MASEIAKAKRQEQCDGALVLRVRRGQELGRRSWSSLTSRTSKSSTATPARQTMTSPGKLVQSDPERGQGEGDLGDTKGELGEPLNAQAHNEKKMNSWGRCFHRVRLLTRCSCSLILFIIHLIRSGLAGTMRETKRSSMRTKLVFGTLAGAVVPRSHR